MQQIKAKTENGSVQENRYDAEGLRFELLENGKHTTSRGGKGTIQIQ